MWRKPASVELDTPLARAMPDADIHMTHERLVEAEAASIWAALARVSFADLPIASALMRLRRIGVTNDAAREPLLTNGPVPADQLDPPHYAAGVKAARPWARRSAPDRPLAIDEVRDFDAPGWLVMGADFRITAVDDSVCLLTTQTRCHATSPQARRRFVVYWSAIGPFSSVIRHEMLDAVARAARSA